MSYIPKRPRYSLSRRGCGSAIPLVVCNTCTHACRFDKVDTLWHIHTHTHLSPNHSPLHLTLLCSCLSSFKYNLRSRPCGSQHRLQKLPFRDVTGCHGNCLLAHSPPTEGAAAAAVDQLDSVARQQVTWRSLATTLLQEPANPLNLSLSPSPPTPCTLPPLPNCH